MGKGYITVLSILDLGALKRLNRVNVFVTFYVFGSPLNKFIMFCAFQ